MYCQLPPPSACLRSANPLSLLPRVLQGVLSKDPSVALEAKVDPLMVKGNVRNKTAFEVVKLIQAAKESASKV